MNVARHGRNTEGTDYVCGDIHGMYSMFRAESERVGFDKARDRMFFVGDLFDRGPENTEAAALLFEPWFYPIRGNHEQMLMDFVDHGDYLLMMNGGTWVGSMESDLLAKVVERVRELPVAREVWVDHDRFGIIHAEVPVGVQDWDTFMTVLEDGEVPKELIWGRTRAMNGLEAPVHGVKTIYCGHTIVDEPVTLGNHRFIDTGAFLASGEYGSVGHSPRITIEVIDATHQPTDQVV